MNKPLFTVILEDESVFYGGDYYKMKWAEIPTNKKIKRLFYTLPDGNSLCLDSYDKYYLFAEGTKNMNGTNIGKVNLEYFYILGKKEDKVVCYKINLFDRPTEHIGNIERIEYSSDGSFVATLNPNFWR